MATANELLNIARGELGIVESPANSNRVKYASWYGLNGQPWCVMFVMWVFNYAKVALPTRTASCTILMNAAKAAGSWITSNYKPGDVVIYDWGNDSVPDHCGIIESVTSTSIVAIEGNTAVGNDSDGGQVMRRTRKLSTVLGAVRPVYEVEMDNTSKIDQAAVNWLVDNGIMQGDVTGNLNLSASLTRDQFAAMLKRYHDKFGNK